MDPDRPLDRTLKTRWFVFFFPKPCIFQKYAALETHKDSNLLLQPTCNTPQILQSMCFALAFLLHHIPSYLLRKEIIQLRKSSSRSDEHIISPKSSLLLSPAPFLCWDCKPDHRRPLRLVLWCGIEAPLPRLAKMIHFSVITMSLWNQLCNLWWVWNQRRHWGANVFILENNAVSWVWEGKEKKQKQKWGKWDSKSSNLSQNYQTAGCKCNLGSESERGARCCDTIAQT